MKICLIKSNQISRELYLGVGKPNVLIPKAILPESNLLELAEVTFDDVLHHVKSELDLVYVNNSYRGYNTIVNDDLQILESAFGRLGNLSQITLDDATIELLGYTAEVVKGGKGIKVAVPDNTSDLFNISTYGYATVNKKNIMVLINEIISKGYVSSMHLIAEYKVNDEEGDPCRESYLINKENINTISDSDFEDKKKRVELSRISFSKIFNREEANDILKIFSKYVENSNITISKVRVEDMYTLV